MIRDLFLGAVIGVILAMAAIDLLVAMGVQP
jgi:hypothetical protein